MAGEINAELLDTKIEKLLDAIAQSGRSYEEIMQYLQSQSEVV